MLVYHYYYANIYLIPYTECLGHGKFAVDSRFFGNFEVNSVQIFFAQFLNL